MRKKIQGMSSYNHMNAEQNMEDLLNHKFKERFEVSNELHHRILESSSEKRTSNFYWFAAAGIVVLILLNVFSIRTYTKQLKSEQLKEFYNNDWNNTAIF